MCLDVGCQSKPLVCFMCHQDYNKSHLTRPLGSFLNELSSRRKDTGTDQLATSAKAKLHTFMLESKENVDRFRKAMLAALK